MIFEPQNYLYIFQDAVYSAAVGFVRAALGRLLTGFLHRTKQGQFAADFITGVFFSLLVVSYSVSFANYNVLRFYNVLFRLAGYFSFPKLASTAVDIFSQILNITCIFLFKSAKEKTVAVVKVYRDKKLKKYQKNAQKSSEKVLSDNDMLLYN